MVHWTTDGKRVLSKLLPSRLNLQEANQELEGDRNEASEDSTGAGVMTYQATRQEDQKLPIKSVSQDDRTRAERANLGFIDVQTGKVITIASNYSPVSYSISPDGLHIAFTTLKGLAGGETYRQIFDLLVVTMNGESTAIAVDIGRFLRNFPFSWSPDGQLLAYIGGAGSGKGESEGECYVVAVGGAFRRKAAAPGPHPTFRDFFEQGPLWDSRSGIIYNITSTFSLSETTLSTGAVRELAKIPDRRIVSLIQPSDGSILRSEQGHPLIIASTRDDTSMQWGFYQIDLTTGDFKKIREEHKNYNAYHVALSSAQRQIVYVAEDVSHYPNFFRADLDSSRCSRLTDIKSQLRQFAMGESRLLDWISDDGEPLHGALLLPAYYESGKQYPLIVEVYPASLSSCLNSFGLCGETYFPNKQLFATRGYAVLFPDAPVRPGSMMEDLAKTVLPGVTKAVELGIVDPKRIGLMGQSWGGYSTLALTVQTNRFRAAVAMSAMSNLIGFYGQMDRDGSSLGISVLEGDYGGRRMPGTLWEFQNSYIRNSPVFLFDRLQTPLLLVHGTKDSSVAPVFADEIFVDLRRLNKDVSYVKYVGEGHAITEWNDTNQLDLIERTIRWFDARLKADP